MFVVAKNFDGKAHLCYCCGHFVYGKECARHHSYRCLALHPVDLKYHSTVTGGHATLGSWIHCNKCPSQYYLARSYHDRRSLLLLSCWIRLLLRARQMSLLRAPLVMTCKQPPFDKALRSIMPFLSWRLAEFLLFIVSSSMLEQDMLCNSRSDLKYTSHLLTWVTGFFYLFTWFWRRQTVKIGALQNWSFSHLSACL